MVFAVSEERLLEFRRFLIENERSRATVEKYLRDVRCFLAFADGRGIFRETVLSFKERLRADHSPAGANSILAAVNAFLRFLGLEAFCVKSFRIQRSAFCREERELSREEYVRLVRTAHEMGNERLALLIETVCGTGIRISELSFITVKGAEEGVINVSLKGKDRTVFLVPALRKKLLAYAEKHGILSGQIFCTRSGRAIDRSNVWREMKALCGAAGVDPKKVFPHNLRHLFARVFYELEKDIVKLADILGHSSVNTTRIYTVSAGVEHRRRMERMRLIL